MQVSTRRPCPHCGSNRTEGNGSFPRKDGTRLARRLCNACGRTFSPNTGTTAHYIKLHRQWAHLPPLMARNLPLRRVASALGIRLDTAFRWRHRVLAETCCRPRPVLTGAVEALEAFIPYSEKGSRSTIGPGAWGRRLLQTGHPGPVMRSFRRFLDGKPSCVLLTCTERQHVLTIVGRGRPQPIDLEKALRPVLGIGAHLWCRGLVPLGDACRLLGVPFGDPESPRRTGNGAPTSGRAGALTGRLRSWLRRFRGVATRYLDHYLAWFSVTRANVEQLRAA